MVIDLVVILIILLSTFIGYKRGLVKVLIKILSFFIALILAFMLCSIITNVIIEKTTLDDKIENLIVEKVLPDGGSQEQTIQMETSLSNLLKIDKVGTVKNIAHQLTTKLIRVLVFIVIFIAVKLILVIVSLLTDVITKIPVIKQFNKLGGTIFGAIKGLLIVYVILAIFYLISPLLKENMTKKIDESILTKFMYNNNIIIKIIT